MDAAMIGARRLAATALGLGVMMVMAAPAFAADAWPTVSLTQPGAGSYGGTIALAATASDDVGVTKVMFRVGGVVAGTDTSPPYSASFDSHAVTDGSTVVAAEAYDTAGHIKTASQTITIDNTPPALDVSGPSGQTFGGGVTESWTLAASDATSGLQSVRCSVVPSGQSASFGACSGGTTSHSVSGLSEGDYRFTVRVTDNAGNTRDRTLSFAIDTTAPETSIVSGIADSATTTATSLTWSFGAGEAGSTFRCRVYPAALTPGPFAPCSGATSHTASGFSPGTYTFEVVATDGAGNSDLTPARRTFTIAAPPPTGDGSHSGATSPSTTVQRLVIHVALRYRFHGKRTRLTRLVIKHVPAGSTVRAKCRHGCARRTLTKRHAHGTVSLKRMVHKWLKPGTRITVTISTPGRGSATEVLVIRRHRHPRAIKRYRPPA